MGGFPDPWLGHSLEWCRERWALGSRPGGQGQGRGRSCPGQASAPRRVDAGCAADPEGAASSLPASSGLTGGWDPTFGFWPLCQQRPRGMPMVDPEAVPRGDRDGIQCLSASHPKACAHHPCTPASRCRGKGEKSRGLGGAQLRGPVQWPVQSLALQMSARGLPFMLSGRWRGPWGWPWR